MGKRFWKNPINILDPIGAYGRIEKEKAQERQREAIQRSQISIQEQRQRALQDLEKINKPVFSDEQLQKEYATVEDVNKDFVRATMQQMATMQAIRNMQKKGIGKDVELKLNLSAAQRIAAQKAAIEQRAKMLNRKAHENYLKARTAIESGTSGQSIQLTLEQAKNISKNLMAEQLYDYGGGLFKMGATLVGSYAGGAIGGQMGGKMGDNVQKNWTKLEDYEVNYA
ncbi:MAG: hypothetical protein D6710_06860, partial [Nitrospirae bacterium]